MQYRRKLDLEIEELRPDLNTLRHASREIRSSAKFKQTLLLILSIGNTLNGSTFRGNAQGFTLDSLLKLKETRTPRGGKECPTLLHYVAKVLLKKDPKLALFIDEMPNVEAAARVSVQTVLHNVQTLVSGMAAVNEELGIARKSKREGDRFVDVMEVRKPLSRRTSHLIYPSRHSLKDSPRVWTLFNIWEKRSTRNSEAF